MKSDVNGCSTCPPGQEQWMEYFSHVLKRTVIGYDYRTPEGKLFACVAATLEKCREKRDRWLAERKAL